MSQASPLVEPQLEAKPQDLTPEEQMYRSRVMARIEESRVARSLKYPEFNNMTYTERYEENKKKANTILPPKKNPEDVEIASGTLEAKLEAVLSSVNNLNLEPQVKAYDKKNNRIMMAGTALEDTISMTEELDEDEEKKLMRQKELLVQGEVFVEERWVKKYKKIKKLTQPFDGKTKNVKWAERIKKYYEGPTRKIVYGPNMYLGDITEFSMENQPFIAIVEVMPYAKAQAIFGDWDNWDMVSKKLKQMVNSDNGTMSPTGSDSSQMTVDKKYLLSPVQGENVEVVTYQDRWNDEIQIFINTVMMLPVGFPLSAFSPNGNYTVDKQVFKTIDPHFAYGRGFIQSTQKASDLLDEMLRLSVLKTRKSFMPPYINTSKKLISARVLSPGKISMGIPADALQMIGKESEGVTASEFQMIKLMQETIDKQTVSQQFAGQQGKSGTTATEVLELQRQARMTLGLIVFVCSMLEKKIGYLRLWNILENWYKPIDEVTLTDEEGKPELNPDGTPQTEAVYRTTSRSTSLEGQGNGERQIIPVSGPLPLPEAIREMERIDEEMLGYPVKKVFMNPQELLKHVNQWYIIVLPKEKDVSSVNKLMFREKLTDLASLISLGSMPDVGVLEEEYSRVWGEDRSKAFKAAPIGGPMAGGIGEGMDPNNPAGAAAMMGGKANVKGMPTMNNIPSA